ncbi:MAG: type III pantothenate kinase [Acidimicrobiia bacterium]|jgi:type III pantothenate kinase
MLLVLDVGNSTTVVGLYRGSVLEWRWRVSTRPRRTPDELRLLLTGLLDGIVPTGAVMGSVVPESVADLRTAVSALVDGPVVTLGPGTRTGMAIRLDNPREVGADRVANAIGAVARFGAPVMIVDVGTATTVDLVGPGGDYQGGAIAPGLDVAAEAVVAAASALRRVELATPEHVVGRSTAEAMQSGLVYGWAGLIDGLVRRIAEEHRLHEPKVVATGGLASLVVPHCSAVTTIDDELTLRGLRIVFERNAQA